MFAMILAVAAQLAGAMQAVTDDGKAASRPEWIELAKDGRLTVHSAAIQSGLWATRDEARSDALEQASYRALDFAAEAVPRLKSRWQVPTWLVADHMLREPVFIEEVDWTYGPMYRAHVLLDLSPEKRDVLLATWHETLLRQRMTQIGGGLAFVLVCVATLFSYLRLDDATRGYYSRWLLTGAFGVVAGSAAVLYTWIV